MCEKRGYPNPNYTEGDILPGITMEVKSELILDDQLIQFIQKAAMFDCLTSAIRSMNEVDDDVVQAITGTWDLKEKSESEKFRMWWHDERSKNEQLIQENEQLKRDVEKLQKLINQLLPAVEEEESGEGANG